MQKILLGLIITVSLTSLESSPSQLPCHPKFVQLKRVQLGQDGLLILEVWQRLRWRRVLSQFGAHDADRGWAQMSIDPATAAVGTVDFGGIVGDDDDLTPALGVTAGTNPVANPNDTAVVAIAVWERSFADQAGNYGRIVEHSTVISAGSLR